MKFLRLIVLTAMLVQWISIPITAKALLVHNTLKEIEACSGKLQLKLIRIWGGENEQDENKFFKLPSGIGISGKEVFIIDENLHCVKVFDLNGRYLRTLSQRGNGPGDLFTPNRIRITHDGDLLIGELLGFRIQRLTSTGKSKNIYKVKNAVYCFDVLKTDEIVIYDRTKTFLTRKVISVLDKNGKVIREFGKYEDTAKDPLLSEGLTITKDINDNIFIAYGRTPVIRKYTPDGQMVMAITYGTPFKPDREAFLNAQGDEIECKGKQQEGEVSRKGGIPHIVKDSGVSVMGTMATDSQNRLYTVVIKRNLTEKEMMATRLLSVNGMVKRDLVDFNIVEKIDNLRLVVFNPNGKVIAEAPLHTFCDGIYIYNNRLFVLDGYLNSRIMEYEMTFTR